MARELTDYCVNCGRDETKTVLNIEGFIHHGKPVLCLNTKDCQKYKRRSKMKAKRDQ